MSRSTVGCCALLVSAAFVSFGEAQTSEPRGRTFSQGGGWTYAPREHRINVPGYPTWVYGGYPTTYGSIVYPGYYWPYPLRPSEMPGSPMMAPADALPVQRDPWNAPAVPKTDPAHRPVVTSSAAARAKALNFLAEGDQYVRQQKWQTAYSAYRQAVQLADDLPEAHLRYGIVFAILGRYDRAAMEFRRAVHVDPSLPESAFSLEMLLGPDSKLWRTSILSRVAEWVEEDVADPERLFVLGVLLHFNRDPRAQDLFSAAARLTRNADHVMAFLARGPMKAKDAPPEPGLDVDEKPVPEAPLPEEPQAAPKPVEPPASKAAPPKPMPKNNNGPVLLPPSPE